MESMGPTNVDVSNFVSKAYGKLRENKRKLDERCSDHALLKMLEEGLHTDITLVAQGGSMKAHRCVLASVSPVFYAMFQHNMKVQLTSTVDIPDMTIDGLQLFLLVLYTTNKFVTKDDLHHTMPELVEAAIDEHFAEFWRAAHKYQVVTRLQNVLLCGLERNLTPDNCWDYIDGSARQVQGACCRYILDHYDAVIESESILKEMRRNPEQVQSIMKMAVKTSQESS